MAAVKRYLPFSPVRLTTPIMPVTINHPRVQLICLPVKRQQSSPETVPAACFCSAAWIITVTELYIKWNFWAAMAIKLKLNWMQYPARCSWWNGMMKKKERLMF